MPHSFAIIFFMDLGHATETHRELLLLIYLAGSRAFFHPWKLKIELYLKL